MSQTGLFGDYQVINKQLIDLLLTSRTSLFSDNCQVILIYLLLTSLTSLFSDYQVINKQLIYLLLTSQTSLFSDIYQVINN